MERISGSSNWKLVIRREAESVTLLQALTCEKKAALPEELFGLPVRALGHHALTPGRTPPAGEIVEITCGTPPADGWDNRQLEQLTLPGTMTRVENYAFYNCTALKTLSLWDTVSLWGGGALMNCRSLSAFHIRCTGREGELLSYLADELIRELDVTLSYANGRSARVIFPEYTEEYEENVPHHQFDFRIQGAGYPYHHCFYGKKFSLKDYDELWKGFLSMGHDEDCALRLAWNRLRYPADLSEAAEEAYLSYLRCHAGKAAARCLAEGDTEGLSFLLPRCEWEKEALAALCDRARAAGNAAALALLLEEQHRRFPAGRGRRFEL